MLSTNKTALSWRDAKLLIKYLDGVDDAVTVRLREGFNPDEPYLTTLLCEMLDQNHTSLHVLNYRFEDLRVDLQADPKSLDAELTVQTVKYPAHLESKVTHSDFGVVVSYEDDALGCAFTRSALFQSKKLYRARGGYSLISQFEAFDLGQLAALANLDLQVPGAAHYLFYCPPPSAFDPVSGSTLHRLVLPGGDIYDFAEGWHKQEYASDPNRHVPGLVVGRLDWMVERYLLETVEGKYEVGSASPVLTARDVYGRFWTGTFPFSWYIVYGMLMGTAGSDDPFAEGLALGLVPMMRRNSQGSDYTPPFLPRFFIRLRVSVRVTQSYHSVDSHERS